MKDLLLVGPILIAGGTILSATQSSSWRPNSSQTQELIFLAFLFGLLYAWHRGKYAAAERLKAMELGWDVPEGPRDSSPARAAIVVGFATPVSLLGLAWMASSSQPEMASSIWFSASLLGMTTLICGTILLLRHPSPSSPRKSNRRSGFALKPKADPDEFDVVGQRGSNGHFSEERA